MPASINIFGSLFQSTSLMTKRTEKILVNQYLPRLNEITNQRVTSDLFLSFELEALYLAIGLGISAWNSVPDSQTIWPRELDAGALAFPPQGC